MPTKTTKKKTKKAPAAPRREKSPKATKPTPKPGAGNTGEPAAPTVAQLADRYLAHLREIGKSDATVFSYSMDLGLAKRELGAETAITDLTPEKIAAFFESETVTRRKNGNPKTKVTVDKTRRVLRMALTWAGEESRLPKPAAK